MRRRIPAASCPIAQTLAVVGEWWTLLILRDAFAGAERFEEFQRSLDIPRNTLTARLATLVKHEILQRVPLATNGKRHKYMLTTAGRELLPVIAGLRQWGRRNLPANTSAGIRLVDRRDGANVEVHIRAVSARGRTVPLDAVAVISSTRNARSKK